MNKRMKLLAVILKLTLILSPLTTFAADGEAKQTNPNQGLVNHVINLEGQSKMTIYDVMLFPTSQGNQLAFKADIYNANNSELSFNYYWLRVLTKQGTRHNVNLVNNEQGTVVPPRTTKTFIFTSMVDDELKLSDISLQVIRWNFSMPNYEQSLGTMSISEAYNPSVPWQIGKEIVIANSPVLFTGERYQVGSLGENYDVKIELNAFNKGKFTVQVPNYSYYIQTEDALVYPVTQNGEDVKVLPNGDSRISLQSTIPKTVDLTKLKLVVVQNFEQHQVPQMMINLPEESSAVEEVYDEYEYDTVDGTYTIIIKNLQRLPNNETDIISVELELANKLNEHALPNMDLVASIEMDNIALEPSEIEGVRLDNNLNIKKGNSITYVFNAEIPYNFEFEQMRFNLSEKRGESSYAIATFTNDVSKFKLDKVSAIKTDTIGKRSTVYILKSNVYEGKETDIIYAAVLMTNNEPRFVTLEQLVAFYKINGEMYFPAEIPDNKVLTMPSGQALIPIYTKIPKGFEIHDLELVLGTQLTDTEYYKQAYVLDVPQPIEDVKEEFTDVKIGNYTVTLEDVKLYMNGGSGELRFKYELSKESYQHELAEHKLRITIVSGDKRYSHDITPGEDLTVDGMYFEMPVSGADLDKNLQRHGYHIEALDVFDDGEKLLVQTKKTYSWFSDTPPQFQ
ncbi:hypothetical protein [Insulibacter thermoxylanivorax]|nr:hypothetical protein [Insulibacter thermoxylanivorax]